MLGPARISGAILVGLTFAACTAPGGPGPPRIGTGPTAERLTLPMRSVRQLAARRLCPRAPASWPRTPFRAAVTPSTPRACSTCSPRTAGSATFKEASAISKSQLAPSRRSWIRTCSTPSGRTTPTCSCRRWRPGRSRFRNAPPNDPTVVLAKLLEQWIAQGRPAVVFNIASEDTGDSPYLLSNDVGLGMTNIGNCVPNRAMYGSAAPTMDEMDTFFARATALPETIRETDLKTLDAAALARSGIIAYAPTYPLWSDSSGKLRHIRVPRGKVRQVRQADADVSRSPPNTRFYKTFLRAVRDRDRQYDVAEDRDAADRRAARHDGPGRHRRSRTRCSAPTSGAKTKPARLANQPLQRSNPCTDIVIQYTADEPNTRSSSTACRPILDTRSRFGNPGLTALRHPWSASLRSVPHGQPDQGLRARLLPAAGRPPGARRAAATNPPARTS